MSVSNKDIKIEKERKRKTMSTQLVICLVIFVLTCAGYMTGVWSLGTVAMTSIAALSLTGCPTAPTASITTSADTAATGRSAGFYFLSHKSRSSLYGINAYFSSIQLYAAAFFLNLISRTICRTTEAINMTAPATTAVPWMFWSSVLKAALFTVPAS